MPDGQVLEFTRVTKRFNDVTAVSDFSARVEPGVVTAFLGPNGAGKTTTLRILLGQVRPTSGTATIGGSAFAELRHPLRTIGSVLEETVYRPRRTATRQLTIAAKANGIPLSRVDEVLALVGLENEGEGRIGSFSLGMRQRLSVAHALLGDPGALVFDEPANGLDPEGIRWMRLLMRRLADEGRTVLVSSHVLSEVEQVADNVLVLSKGQLVLSSGIEQLADPSSGSVVVDAADRAALRTALAGAGFDIEVLRSGLTVRGADAKTVGAVAADAGIALSTLVQRGPTLEDVFIELVRGGTLTPRAEAAATQLVRPEYAEAGAEPATEAEAPAEAEPLVEAEAVPGDPLAAAVLTAGAGAAIADETGAASADTTDADIESAEGADAAEPVPADEPADGGDPAEGEASADADSEAEPGSAPESEAGVEPEAGAESEPVDAAESEAAAETDPVDTAESDESLTAAEPESEIEPANEAETADGSEDLADDADAVEVPAEGESAPDAEDEIAAVDDDATPAAPADAEADTYTDTEQADSTEPENPLLPFAPTASPVEADEPEDVPAPPLSSLFATRAAAREAEAERAEASEGEHTEPSGGEDGEEPASAAPSFDDILFGTAPVPASEPLSLTEPEAEAESESESEESVATDTDSVEPETEQSSPDESGDDEHASDEAEADEEHSGVEFFEDLEVSDDADSDDAEAADEDVDPRSAAVSSMLAAAARAYYEDEPRDYPFSTPASAGDSDDSSEEGQEGEDAHWAVAHTGIIDAVPGTEGAGEGSADSDGEAPVEEVPEVEGEADSADADGEGSTENTDADEDEGSAENTDADRDAGEHHEHEHGEHHEHEHHEHHHG